jgi:LPXTG-motif cell wall-anchored protein
MNPSDQSRQVFYIDTTSRLQQYNCNSISCTLLQPQESSIWPVADQPNAPIGITNALDTTEIFYYSNGSLIVVELDSENNWQPASVLPTTATKSTGPTAAKSTGTAVTNATGTAVTSATKLGSSTTSAIPTSQPSNGLSAGNAAEIAAGIVGGVALVAGIIFFFWRRKRQGGWFQYPKSAWLLPAEVTDTQRHEMDGKMKNKLELQASMRSEME